MGRLSDGSVDVVVVGGGVIGVTTAIALAASGRSVRILDAGTFSDGTSHGNAGMLCPSYATPIATPRALADACIWLLGRDAPLTLAMHPWEPAIAGWLARFVVACGPAQLRRSTALLADLARRGIAWHAVFAAEAPDYALRRDGWLYVFRTARGYAQGLRHARAIGSVGVAWNALGPREALDCEPALRRPAGAILYPGDAHLDPHAFLATATAHARARGVDLVDATRVVSITPESQRVRIATHRGEHVARHVVLAAGSWTAELARALGARLPILPARGHSASLRAARLPRIPLMLSEAHVVVTPMGERVRMTSGLELGSFDPVPDAAKLRTMAAAAGDYLAGGVPSFSEGWAGLRPLTPDGVPIIGPLSHNPRVIVAAGHGTLGMTLAPATAELVRDAIGGESVTALLSPRRFGC